MVGYRTHRLENGLAVVTHEAYDTPLATVSLLYAVGSRNENPQRTGFAHLFEHLMFGGTPEVPDFDAVVNSLGGESNAFTNCDYTNYYITLPVDGLATALHLEADRMAHLDISNRAFEVQQQVVTEEYHQRYLSSPYGDVWLLLRPLCYRAHPYRWATIGADIRHVGEATLDDVRDFHRRHYRPDNAILSIAAPLRHDEMLRMASEAWQSAVSALPVRTDYSLADLPVEPRQTERRELHVKREVPSTAIYLAWPMCDHRHPHFRACDLLTDLLASGKSSRLHQRLVLGSHLFTEANACITGDVDNGLLVLTGKLQPGIHPDEGADALRREAQCLADEGISDYELGKVQNRYENTFVFSQYKAADRAMGLCYYTFLGQTDLINREPEAYRQVTAEQMHEAAREVFRPESENCLYYECQ